MAEPRNPASSRQWSSVAAVLLFVLAFAGCVDQPAPAGATTEPAPVGPSGRYVTGVVVDDELRPLAGATIIHLGGASNATSDEIGNFTIDGLPPLKEILLQARHPEYNAQTVSVNLEFVPKADVRFVLGGGPGPAGYHVTNITAGEITCQVAAGSHHGSPGLYKYSCRDVVGDETGITLEHIRVPVEPGITAVVVELQWEPQSQMADVMGLLVYASTPEEELLIGSLHSFPGGHYIQMKASTAALQSARTAGGDIESFVHVDPGVLDEHVPNMGAVVQQKFTLYTTAFYGEVPPPVWTAIEA